LRALIADQAFHLSRTLEQFGVSCVVLNGDTPSDERAGIFGDIAAGACDIVLTTPEFLACHVERFAAAPKLRFVVIDEAHHIGLAKAGHRGAYHALRRDLGMMGNPLVLAITATADDDIADEITSELGISNRVFDRYARENLKLDDQRGLRKRADFLANLVARGEKTVIYVNSRAESVSLARHLRARVPQLASLIGFYNAGLSREERTRVEDLFRRDQLCVLVATSAFGEGVNIPNIRHAVLFHLPFNEVEFNQMCGRVGRDGAEATIHLLFGRSDKQVNEGILRNQTPGRDVMAQVYRTLRARQRVSGAMPFEAVSTMLASEASSLPGAMPVSPEAVQCGIAVFRELDLLRVATRDAVGDAGRYVYVPETASKVELSDSVRYREGLEELDIFERFSDWVLSASPDALRRAIIRHILPGCGYGLYDTGRG
jgi:single-stranded-DNA-specific exonuclease